MRFLLLVALFLAPTARAATIAELVDQAETLLRGTTSRMTLEMTVTTPSWSRTMTLSVQERSPDFALIRITAPARDAGSGTLKRGQQLWTYVPNINKVMKIPPSLMTGSWMGSDFTNDDVTRETSLRRDFELSDGGTRVVGGVTGRLIILVPKPEAPITYAKMELVVNEKGGLPLSQTYFDESGERVREMLFEGYAPAPGRPAFPYRWTMKSLQKPGHQTVMVVKSVAFDVDVPESLFTLRALERGAR